MRRTWTEEEILIWTQRRDAYRASKNLKPLAALRNSIDQKDKEEYAAALKLEREALLTKLHTDCTKLLAWPIQKHPLREYRAPFSGELFFPTNYRQTHGAIKYHFHAGEDLYRAIYNFYNEKVEDSYPGVNFVTPDAFAPSRDEYLGPMPHVVGFQFFEKRGEAFIEWWDDYLQMAWIGTGTWKNEVYFDEAVQGWVSELRGDFSQNLDLTVYTGTDPRPP